ncbi:MAG: signal peptide peptidase SppA [bacterium]
MSVALLVLCLVAGPPQVPASWATTDDILAVFANPAGLARARGANVALLYNFAPAPLSDNGAVAAGFGPLAGYLSATGCGLALGAGDEAAMAGLRVEHDSLTRWTIGSLTRPTGWLSIGLVWRDLTRDWGSLGGAVAVRPFGRRLTLSADAATGALGRGGFTPAHPVVGLDLEPLDGLVLSGRVKPSDWSFNAGVRVGLGRLGVGGVGSRIGNAGQAGGYVTIGSQPRRSLVPGPARWLELRLAGPLNEGEVGFSLFGSRGGRDFRGLLEFIGRAGRDRSVRGLVIRLDGLSAGYAQLSELRRALAAFRATGREVICYADSYGMGGYYLASVADLVVCHPMGGVSVPGLYTEPMFVRGALEKLGLEVDVVRYGEYKSAPEILTEDSLSAFNREQLEALLDAMYDEFLAAAGAGRELARESVVALVDHGHFLPREALAAGLVDTFCYADELDSLLRRDRARFRRRPERELPTRPDDSRWGPRPAIAVISAVGGIAGGRSGTDFLTGDRRMGSATMVKAIRAARNDRRVKAIVLRVDSPGGDGFASDLIWHELEKAKAKKPLVVSMGNLAASGGYYISMGADRIFAEPTTLTGSIGAFSLKFVTGQLYDKLGIRRQVLKRGERADMQSDARRYTPAEDSLLQGQLDWFYREFVGRVARGRRMSYEAVDSVARGRVWSGRDALAVGLVDSLGGLEAAVDWARGRAKLRDADVVSWPKSGPGSLFSPERLMTRLLRGVTGWQ